MKLLSESEEQQVRLLELEQQAAKNLQRAVDAEQLLEQIAEQCSERVRQDDCDASTTYVDSNNLNREQLLKRITRLQTLLDNISELLVSDGYDVGE